MRRDVALNVIYGLALAFIASALINLPLLRAIVLNQEMRYPDIVRESSDEAFYLARIREVGDGHSGIGNPAMWERRLQQYPLGNLAELIEAIPLLLGVPIKTVSVAVDFIAPFLLVFLLWLASRPLLPKPWQRTLLIGLLFLGPSLILWKRPISPQITDLFLFAYLLFFLSPKRNKPLYVLLRSTLIGLMLYVYPFHWTYCLAAEALLLLETMAKQPTWRERLRQTSFVVIPLILIGSPYLLHMAQWSANPIAAETWKRLGIIDTHWPSNPFLQGELLIMFLLLLWQGKRKREFSAILPLCILLLAGILVLNQSLLTGHEAEFSSHYQKILIVPLTMSALLAISFFLRKPRTEFAFFLAVTLAIIFSTIHVESDESAKWTAFCPTRNSRVAFEEEIHQLNNLPKEQVVLTTLKAADDLMIYTNHYPFFSEQDYMYGASDAELLKRGIIQHDLVPSQPIPPRDIFGTYAVNKALNLTQQCRVLSLFLRSRESCAVAREQFLPHGWQDSIDSQLSARQILEALKKAHVTYALLPSVPPALKNYTEILQHFPDLLLLRLNYP